MNPIATYTESLLHVRRQFDLYPDRVTIRAHWRFKGKSYNQTVRLDTLKPETHELRIRYRIHYWAGWVLALASLAMAISVYQTHGRFVGPIAWAGLAMAVGGALTLAITHRDRRIRFVRFKTEEGRAGLDIGQAGPQRGQFDEFIRQIRKQIFKGR